MISIHSSHSFLPILLSFRDKVSKLHRISNENQFVESNSAVDNAAEDLAADKDGQKTWSYFTYFNEKIFKKTAFQ